MITDRNLADALRDSIKSVAYAVDALQAPERCAMREDLANARAILAAWDAQEKKEAAERAQRREDAARVASEHARNALANPEQWKRNPRFIKHAQRAAETVEDALRSLASYRERMGDNADPQWIATREDWIRRTARDAAIYSRRSYETATRRA